MIIDANVANKLVSNPVDAGAKTITDHIEKRRLQIACGGKLAEELQKTKAWRLIKEYIRNGSAKLYPSSSINIAAQKLINDGNCVSNDIHIIALANISNARLLYSMDGDLEADFTNKSLVDKPRGKIYKRHSHRKLLLSCPACK